MTDVPRFSSTLSKFLAWNVPKSRLKDAIPALITDSLSFQVESHQYIDAANVVVYSEAVIRSNTNQIRATGRHVCVARYADIRPQEISLGRRILKKYRQEAVYHGSILGVAYFSEAGKYLDPVHTTERFIFA